jgi:hypothetical protein
MQSMRFPDFIVIGAQNSGTTFLDTLLREHPGIFMPRKLKETHFFDLYFDRGPEWYSSMFQKTGSLICGENTPNYLFNAEAPSRILSLIPNVRLIAVLRNPVERILSGYRKAVTRFGLKVSIRPFLEENQNIISVSRYYEQFVRYFNSFKHDQIQILLFEELIASPVTEMHAVFRFIGVDDTFCPSSIDIAANQTIEPRFRPLWSVVRPITRWLFDHNMATVHYYLKSLGLKKFFFPRNNMTKDWKRPLSEDLDWIRDQVVNDVEQLSRIIGQDMVKYWRLNR